MNPESVAGLLEPLREPPPLSWWPPAPGWWLLTAVALATAAWLLLALRQRWRRRAALRIAQRELRRLEEADLPAPRLAEELATLQRRLLLSRSRQGPSARLSGVAWVAHLNELAGEAILSPENADLAYRPVLERERVLAALDENRRWLKRLGRSW